MAKPMAECCLPRYSAARSSVCGSKHTSIRANELSVKGDTTKHEQKAEAAICAHMRAVPPLCESSRVELVESVEALLVFLSSVYLHTHFLTSRILCNERSQHEFGGIGFCSHFSIDVAFVCARSVCATELAVLMSRREWRESLFEIAELTVQEVLDSDWRRESRDG